MYCHLNELEARSAVLSKLGHAAGLAPTIAVTETNATLAEPFSVTLVDTASAQAAVHRQP